MDELGVVIKLSLHHESFGSPCAGGTFFNACLVHAGGIPNHIAPSLPLTTLVMTILSTSDVGWIREGKKCVAYSFSRANMLIWDCFFVVFFGGGCAVGFGVFSGRKWMQPSRKLTKSAPENRKGRLNPEKVQRMIASLCYHLFFFRVLRYSF